MPSTVWYSCSPFETGDIKTGSPTITISSGVATLSVAQTGNIGCGDCIEYASMAVYITPNRLGFDSGGTTEIKVGDKIQGATSGATGIIRAVELTSGSWSSGDAAGYFYFEQTTGTWQDGETINRSRPSNASNVATVNGTLQGNIGNGNTQFVVKTATGGTPSDQSSTSVTSIHHEYASLNDLVTGFVDANHINSTDLTSAGADVIVHACCYYDHVDYTEDSNAVTIDFGTTDATHYFFAFAPTGGSESVSSQRHNGKWDDNKYKVEGSSVVLMEIRELYCRVLGLQFKLTDTSSSGYYCVLLAGIDSTSNEYIIAYNIFKGVFSGAYSDNNSGVRVSDSDIRGAKIYNNIFYDFKNPDNASRTHWGVFNPYQGWAYVYNNTFVNCIRGIEVGSSSYTLVKNCLAQSCTDGFNGTFDSASDYNCSDISGDAPGANSVTGTVTFEDAPNDDYHLASSDTVAKDAGTDLSTDSYLSIWRDIDGEDRVGEYWDIGSDRIKGEESNWLTGYSKRIKLTIDHTKVDEDLPYFPVTVFFTGSQGEEVFSELTSDSDYMKCAFAINNNATQLYAEKEEFDVANTKAVYHVNIPHVFAIEDIEVYFYYDSTASDNTDYVGGIGSGVGQKVWMGGFAAVYHMVDDTTSTIKDSTSNGSDGTKKGANEPIEADGKIGKAQDFDGNDYIDILQSLDDPTSVTWEVVYKSDVSDTTEQRLFAYNEDNVFVMTSINGGTTNLIRVYCKADSGGGYAGNVTSYSVTEWHYIVGRAVENDVVDMLVDGAVVGYSISLGNFITAPTLGRVIGSSRGYLWHTKGLIDEVRISPVKRSNTWIKATYNTLWDTFLAYGSEETQTGGEKAIMNQFQKNNLGADLFNGSLL